MLNRLIRLISALVLCLLPLTSPVSAQESMGADYYVTRADDPTPNGCAIGDCSLREAIIAANSNPDHSFIQFTTTDRIELSLAGAGEDLAATGDLDIIYPTTINASFNTIDANGIDRVFDIVPLDMNARGNRSPSGPDAQLFTMTITGGLVDVTSEGGAVAGGGIRVGAGRRLATGLIIVTGNTGGGGNFGLGGGIGNEGGIVELADAAVINNTADNAGGIANVDGEMFLWDSTVSTNTAVGAIGGIINLANTDGVTTTLHLDSVTIANNIEEAPSTSGAGLDTTTFAGNAETLIQNSIVANNVGDLQCFAGGSGDGGVITSLGYNLSSDATCSFDGTADLVDTDPVLGPLTVGLGNTYYHPLLAASPAIDTGNTGNLQDQLGTPRPQDIAGYANTVDGDDRGAFELVTVPTAVSLADFTLNNAYTPNLWPQPFILMGVGVVIAGVVVFKRRA